MLFLFLFLASTVVTSLTSLLVLLFGIFFLFWMLKGKSLNFDGMASDSERRIGRRRSRAKQFFLSSFLLQLTVRRHFGWQGCSGRRLFVFFHELQKPTVRLFFLRGLARTCICSCRSASRVTRVLWPARATSSNVEHVINHRNCQLRDASRGAANRAGHAIETWADWLPALLTASLMLASRPRISRPQAPDFSCSVSCLPLFLSCLPLSLSLFLLSPSPSFSGVTNKLKGRVANNINIRIPRGCT